MRTKAARLLVGVTLALTGLAVAAHAAFAQTAPSQTIVQLELSGVVDGFVADYLTGSIARAQDAGDQAVVIQIDTPGGLDSSMRQITQGILSADIPVICYVAPGGARAASAGAFILESCPVAAMAPGTNVGAATPIGLSGGDLSNKIANDAAAYMRTLTETYGRNADVTVTFVTDATSITADEALAQDVIDLEANSTEDLLSQLDGQTITLGNGRSVTLSTADATLQPQSMGGFVGFLHALFDPSLAFLFFWLGLGLIVLELIVPGHIFSGTIGTILLIISLISFGLLPVRLIGIVLLIVSVVAFVIELKAPGLGVWGAIGVITLLLGGWFLYDRSGGVRVAPGVLIGVAIGAGLFFGVLVAAALRVRREPSIEVGKPLIGSEGVALPMGIGPKGGIVRVAAEEWRATSPTGADPWGREDPRDRPPGPGPHRGARRRGLGPRARPI